MIGYRREIDGLRAVAVLPVILFHAGFDTFGGGYVGVDVFFVISGYLITSIILSEKRAGTFSLFHFYERRARRILPALFLVMAVCIPFAWMSLLPNDLKDFSKSLVAVSMFASNILFWNESGYFDTTAEFKPLLHTWSLAVEEQFYLLFPLFIVLTWRLGKRWIVALLAFVALTSLGLAQWGAYNRPNATFFLLPTRGWELAIGAFIAFYFSNKKALEFGKVIREVSSALGVALIGYAILAYSETTPFPSVHALVPTIGTALVILFATPATIVGRLLGSRALVGIGLISYSAYLWHQPLFAFARHKALAEPDDALMLGLGVLTLGLAYSSWWIVERPFRARTTFSSKQVWVLSVIGTGLFVVLGMWGHLSNGFEKNFLLRLDSKQQEIWLAFNKSAYEKMVDNGDCHFHSVKITEDILERFDQCHTKYGKALIILGDSHAMDVFNAVTYNTARQFVFGISAGDCRPHTPGQLCHFDDFLQLVREKSASIEVVLYNQAGFYLIEDRDKGPGRRALFKRSDIALYPVNQDFVERVAEYLSVVARYNQVYWLGSWIEPHLNARQLLRFSLQCEENTINVNRNIIATFAALDSYLEERLSDEPEIKYVSAIEALKFDWDTDLYSCDGVYWSDGDHFTPLGEQRFGARLVNALGFSD